MKTTRLESALALCLLALAGCAVGPDYARPQLDTGRAYAQGPAMDERAERDIPADWWTAFGHPELDRLVAEALRANPTLEAARHALRVAQENRRVQDAALWPQLQASYSPTRTKIAGNLGGNSPGVQGDGSVIETGANTPAAEGGTAPFNTPVIYNFHTAQVSVSYAPDVFGANRRQSEAAAALAEAQRHEWQAARVTLVANLVSAAIQDGQWREQIRAAEAGAQAAEAALQLAQRQRRAGYAAAQDEDAARSALLAQQQILPGLRQQLEQNRHLMRTLIGAPQDRPMPEFALHDFRLPPELPLSLPSRLLEQRPDVRAAEEQLHAAVAQVGGARAARLPQFSITGNAGGAAAHLSQAFWASGRFFDLTANLVVPLFDAGAARHRERAAAAAADQAQAQYRATVLAALQNVADALHAIEADEKAFELAERGRDVARRSWATAKRRQDAGYADRTGTLAAELASRQAEQQLAGAQATRLSNVVALFQALGGGWWNLPPESAQLR
ncbi:efflux transporter outer membrane subunit [Roseateles sp.]|uniref:efflux transporter outer membrane subunit n=1 Tax=Roseateles sp. TaxID=1971397 RepID=UPI0025FC709C|nr:efflux transporter outer membrane subunit [Roseateles sp.]MBV8037685.1 efflux transporter outer membrane subunit [Roseateles sp.]